MKKQWMYKLYEFWLFVNYLSCLAPVVENLKERLQYLHNLHTAGKRSWIYSVLFLLDFAMDFAISYIIYHAYVFCFVFCSLFSMLQDVALKEWIKWCTIYHCGYYTVTNVFLQNKYDKLFPNNFIPKAFRRFFGLQ